MTEGGVGRAAQTQRRPRTRKPGAGRRRDPAIDEKIRYAARALYAREGWAGFHFEGVARAAGVSKDAVYRRFPDAKSLLLEALSDQPVPLLSADPPIEKALISFACDAFTYFASGDGLANLRVHVDGLQHPDILQEYRSRVVQPQIEHAVTVLEDAQRGGQLHPDASPAAVIEALGGVIMVHALATTPHLTVTGSPDAATTAQITAFVEQILHGRVAAQSSR